MLRGAAGALRRRSESRGSAERSCWMMEVVQAKWHQGWAARRDAGMSHSCFSGYFSQVCIVQTDGKLCKLLLLL